MKIAVVAANGQAGQRIVEEAVNRGHDVTAIVRKNNHTKAQHVLQKDLFDLTREELLSFDVVVTAFGAFAAELLPQHTTSLEHLAQALINSPTRLLVVGGAGSLYVNQEKTVQLSQTEGFPEEFFPLATAMAKGLERLRSFEHVKWTYISPAADFQADGPRTGHYILEGEYFSTDNNGNSAISYSDYAIAMVDEIEAAKHIQERISVRW